MKKILAIFLSLFIIPVHATLNWTQQDITLNGVDINQQSDLLTLPLVKSTDSYSEMWTVCSNSQTPLPSMPDDLTLANAKITRGVTNVSSLPGSASKTPAKFSVTQAVNPMTVTVYCSPIIRLDGTSQYLNGNDARINGDAVELKINYSSAPQLFLKPKSATLDLGQCQTGGSLDKPLPVDMYFVGDTVPGGLKTTLTWTFTSNSGNPETSTPEVKRWGNIMTSAPALFTQVSNDAGLSLLFHCGKPGSYRWTMNLTATPL